MLNGLYDSILSNLPLSLTGFIIGLAILILSAEYFTRYAEKLGFILGIPSFIVGLTIVSIGTSLPELATSVLATLRGASEYVAGNVIGSNIANILLVIGVITIFAKHVRIEWDIIKVDLPLLLASAFLLAYMCIDGVFTYKEAIIGLFCFVVYLIYTLKVKHDHKVKKEPFSLKTPIILFIAGAFIYFSAELTIRSVIISSTFLGLADTSVLALTAVAIGTSLPELMVSFMAVKKRNFELALGNVLGSNIFNSFIVMGIPAFMSDLVVPPNVIYIGIPFMLMATFLYLVSGMDKEISIYEGAVFLAVYALFIGKLLGVV